jgi:tetratricopeptide (TPR) repeat protein
MNAFWKLFGVFSKSDCSAVTISTVRLTQQDTIELIFHFTEYNHTTGAIYRFMALLSGKSGSVLLALGLFLVTYPALFAEDADPIALNQQVSRLIEQGNYQEAIPIAERAVEAAKKTRGLEHPDTATSLNNLATLYQDMGDYAKAEPLFQEALRIRQKVLGPEHPDTAESLNNLAMLYHAMGEYAKAIPLLQETLRICQKVLGPDHPNTVISLNNLAMLYRAMGDYTKAEPAYQEALRIRQKVLGPEHSDTAISLSNLGEPGNGRVPQSRTASSRGSPDLTEGSWARSSLHGDLPQ